MRILTLREAVRQIRLTAQDDPKAFFFMTGAGISYPEVPLAGGIVELCRKRLDDDGPMVSGSPMERYAHYFEEAFPSPAGRRGCLGGIIEGKQVSQANLRLAHLLISGKLPKLVVTTNFDDFLSRALTLFGAEHVVCEHPETLVKVVRDSDSIQIVHVHGTYWFYDCKNLPGEINQAAQRTEDSPFSMRGFLEELLNHRSPLVVGYSGWEGDVFMTALRHRLQRPLGYRVYWFCYRKSESDQMPGWLKDDPNVCFVCPDEAKPAAPSPADPPSGVHQITVEVSDDLRSGLELVDSAVSKTSALSEKMPGEGGQGARDVFDELLRAFGVGDAEISKDPFGFYLRYFNKVAPKDESGELDKYFRGVIEKFESVVARTQTTGKLDELRSQLRIAQYREAVGVAKRLSLGRLSPDQLREFAGAMEEAAQGLLDDSEEELAAYELTQRAFERLWAKSQDNSTLSPWARAMFYRAITLGNRDRGEEAITAFGQFVSRFANTEDPEVAEQVATALVNKGVTLVQLERIEEAIAVYDEVVSRYGDSKEAGIAELVAMALVNKGIRLGQLERSEEAVAVCDEVVSRFGDAQEAGIAEQVAKALVTKGITLGQLGRNEEEVAVYDEVVSRYGDSKEAGIAKQVANALDFKGVTLELLGRSEEAVAVFEEVVGRFEDSKEAAIEEIVEKARRLMKAQPTALGDSEPPPDGGPPEAEDPRS